MRQKYRVSLHTVVPIGLSRRRKPPSRIILYKPKNRRKKYGLAAKPPRITFMASRRKKCSFLAHTCRSSRLSSSFSSSDGPTHIMSNIAPHQSGQSLVLGESKPKKLSALKYSLYLCCFLVFFPFYFDI